MVSALSWFLVGDDSDYSYAQVATSGPNTLPLFIWGQDAASQFQNQQTPIQLPKLWQGSLAEWGNEVEKANRRTGHMNREGS